MRKKRIFKRQLAQELVNLGHKLVKIEDNTVNPGFKVYVFEATFELHEVIYEINNRKR